MSLYRRTDFFDVWVSLWRLIMKGQLYSFDVYDTLITRRTATPEGIFALMQKQLTESEAYADLPKMLIQNFYLIRIQSEKVARNTYIGGNVYDITLSQIY